MVQRLVGSPFESEDGVQVYRCSESDWVHRFTCRRQFEIPLTEPPAVLGVFPPRSRCGNFRFGFRVLIEPDFGVQTLWLRLKRLPFRGLKVFNRLGQLCDTARLFPQLA